MEIGRSQWADQIGDMFNLAKTSVYSKVLASSVET
jgi:hypothetical protein